MVTAFPPDTPLLTSLHSELIYKDACKKYGTLNPHGSNERFSFNDLLVVPVWCHEEAAWLSSQLFGLAIRRFQL